MQIDFPYGFDARGRTATTSYPDHIRDMIELVLLTDPGERVNRPDFGSGLIQLVHAPNSPELAAALQVSMRADLERWLGDVIQVLDLTVDSNDSKLIIEVRYVIVRTGDPHEVKVERALT